MRAVFFFSTLLHITRCSALIPLHARYNNVLCCCRCEYFLARACGCSIEEGVFFSLLWVNYSEAISFFSRTKNLERTAEPRNDKSRGFPRSPYLKFLRPLQARGEHTSTGDARVHIYTYYTSLGTHLQPWRRCRSSRAGRAGSPTPCLLCPTFSCGTF